MKKNSLLLVLLLLIFSTSFSQSVPQGMKYQAVARNLTGNVIANQEISLKVSLLTNENASVIHYSEMHTVTTNQLGFYTGISLPGREVFQDLQQVVVAKQMLFVVSRRLQVLRRIRGLCQLEQQ